MPRRELPRPAIRVVWEHYGGITTGRAVAGWIKARCCLHPDRNPSAQINEDTDRYRCFTCGVSGDALDLIMRHDGVDFTAALTVADGFVADGGGSVSQLDRPETSLLPSRPRSRQGRRNWTPPWVGR